MKRFAVWVPPKFRKIASVKGDDFWVLDGECDDYVSLENRGIWNTRKMAEQAIAEDWEEVIEIEVES